ncbi:MAG: hypothetical protein QNJ84_08720 [Alphaproteobacteria bacterium]|nr:hypothetical protein [Alphaproteobacteria bacterium]
MGGIKHEAMKQRDAALPATTLGELSDRGVGVFCWCNRCGHNATIAVARLIAELGPQFPVPEIGAKMRCSGCGCRDVATRPDWPSLGQVADHTSHF